MHGTIDKLSKAKARLNHRSPFFATLLLRTEVVISDAIPYAATDGDRIYFNPDFLDECSVEDVMSVLAHEVGHNVFLHSLRLCGRDPDLWNISGDHVINLVLEDQGFLSPKPLPGGWLADRKYTNWETDRVYMDLWRNPPPPQPGNGGGQGDPGDGDADNDGNPSSGGSPSPADGHKRCGMHGDVLPPKAQTPEERNKAEERMKQRVASAASMARMAGKLSGSLERLVSELLDPRVPWTDVLRDYMLRTVKNREDWSKRNRRFRTVVLPTRFDRSMGPMFFIPDTSGSMFGDDMEKICSEMAHCASQVQPESIRVLWADTEVKGEQVFSASEFDYKALQPVGGGGTDMRVPLQHVEQFDPLVVVLMTDGYTPWPSAPPPYPLIILCTTDAEVPPIGDVIRI